MGLRIKVLMPLFLFCLLLLAYLYGYWMPHSLANIEEEYNRSTERHLDSVAESLVPLILGHQLDTIYENLDFLKKKNKEWVSIQLINAEEKSIYPLVTEAESAGAKSNHFHRIEQKIYYMDKYLGKLVIKVNFNPRLAAVQKRHRQLITAFLLIVSFFLVATWLMIENAVGRPVRSLANATERLAAGDFDVPLIKVGDDEIGTLVDSFARMRESIRNYQAELILGNESLLKLSQAVDQSPVAIVITDANANIEFVNPQFVRSTGYEPAEVIGKNPRLLKSGGTTREEYTELWKTITSGRVWHGEFLNRKKDGDLFWESASISPIQNENGVITHYLAIKEDITERKKLEDQLRQVQKMEAIGQLAGGIAHDFNNLLTALIGYGSLLKMKMEEDSPLKTYADQILTISEKAANLTRQLLAFSRKQIISPRKVDLNGIIKGMEKLALRLLGEDIEIKVQLTEKNLTVMVDPGQMEQVLMNLVTNARDAMPNGGLLSITTDSAFLDEQFARTHAVNETGTYAVMTVSDNGSGMDEKTIGRIFEPFFTTKELGRGTGLGLSIVYGIIKQHNGYINVYSEPDKGTIFRIYLPLVRTDSEETIPVMPAMPARGSETILVAEDNADLRALTHHVLENFGYRVVEAADGEEAVLRFEENRDKIQLAILDVIMPKKNGKEVSDEIKKIRPDIRVLFTSGYTADIIHKEGIMEEGTDFISKPVTPNDLLTRVRQILDRAAPQNHNNHG